MIRLLIGLWLAFFTLTVHAQMMTDGILINAKFMDKNGDRAILEGDVQLVYDTQHVSCDKAVIDMKKKQLVAEGHVIMYNERVHIEGERIVFNYKQNTGYIYKGFVQSGQILFEGDVIQKQGEAHYLANNAQFTACETCPPGWIFSGKSIDAEIGGYARIRRPVLRIGGIPMLWLPSLIVPLKSSRQSGVLVPTFEGSGRGGGAIAPSYFWAIDRSSDLTFTPIIYEKLGYKILSDYRYVISEESAGQLQGAWIRDKLFPSENKDYKINSSFDRWFLSYHHRLELPEDYVHRLDLKGVSDLRYPRDFPEEVKGHGDPALENKSSISQSTDNTSMSAEVDVYTNLLKAYPLSDNSDAVHRFPELRYNLKERSIMETGLYFTMDVSYVGFTRDQFAYDDLTARSGTTPGHATVGGEGEIAHDGEFTPDQDLLRTGQRLDIQPAFTYPFQLFRKFDVLPSVSLRETQYRFNPPGEAEANGYGTTAARRYVQTDLKIKTEFSRVFGDAGDPKATRLKHSIEPELSYSQIPWMRRPSHDDHRFFGDFEGLQFSRQFEPLSDADIQNPNTGVQFDYQDRTYERQVVDFALTNRITRKYWRDGNPDYATVGLFRISQSYDFKEAQALDTPHPWSSINALLDARFPHFQTYTTAAYNGYAKVTNLSSKLRFLANPKNFLELRYTRNFILSDNYEVVKDGETRNFGFGAGLVSRHVEAQGAFEYDARTFGLQSFGYALVFKPPGNCWYVRFEHSQAVGADTKFRLNASFDWGGENKEALF